MTATAPVTPKSTDFRDPWVWVMAVLVAALHLAVAARYDYFRNELYFIACGRHPAFGYADQPPLVPLLAAATQLFGPNLSLLRLPAALAAGGCDAQDDLAAVGGAGGFGDQAGLDQFGQQTGEGLRLLAFGIRQRPLRGGAMAVQAGEDGELV